MWISRSYLVLLVILVLFIIGCTSNMNAIPTLTAYPSMTATARPALETVKGSLGNPIATLEVNMPHRDSEGYAPPTREEQADCVKLMSMLMTNDLTHAAALATKENYIMNYFVDRGDNNAVSYLLREQ